MGKFTKQLQALSTPKDMDFVIRFGKHRGLTIRQILYSNPGYIVWLADNDVMPIIPAIIGTARAMSSETSTGYREVSDEERARWRV